MELGIDVGLSPGDFVLDGDQEQRENIEAFEMWCYRRALRTSNDEVLSRMSQSRKLLSRVKSRKLKYFGHVARHPSMDKDIMLSQCLEHLGKVGKDGSGSTTPLTGLS